MTLIVYQPEFYHREVDFCKVIGSRSKSEVESLLLKNGISYFIDMQKESLLRRLFSFQDNQEKRIFIFKINEADIDKANNLIKDFDPAQVSSITRES